MSRDQHSRIAGATAAVITGGIAFVTAKKLSENNRFKRKATAKAFKLIGNIMDMI